MVKFRRLRERLTRSAASRSAEMLTPAPPPALPRLPLGARGRLLLARWWISRKVNTLSDTGLWRLVTGTAVFIGILALGIVGLALIGVTRVLDIIAGR